MGNKGWMEIAIKFGVPAAIACYLVYFMAGKVDGKLDDTLMLMRTHVVDSTHQSRALDKLILINQQQCINSAVMAKRNPQECLK